jgi:hypothetical protein
MLRRRPRPVVGFAGCDDGLGRADPAGVLDPAVFTVEQTSTASSLRAWLRAAQCPGSGQERRGMGEATMGR